MILVADLAESTIGHEKLAGTIFLTAFKLAPAMNPQPGTESCTSTIPYNTTVCETGYTKHLDPITNEPYTVLPPYWYIPANYTTKKTIPP
jgi:hypothetical protein